MASLEDAVILKHRKKMLLRSVKDLYDLQINKIESALHKSYVKKNFRKVRILDILAILVLVFNLGALVLTNSLVVSSIPADQTVKFTEMNPVQCGVNGFECHKNTTVQKKSPASYAVVLGFFLLFVRQAILWSFLVSYYVYHRRSLYSDIKYAILLGMVVGVLLVSSWDFFHDLGLYFGTLKR